MEVNDPTQEINLDGGGGSGSGNNSGSSTSTSIVPYLINQKEWTKIVDSRIIGNTSSFPINDSIPSGYFKYGGENYPINYIIPSSIYQASDKKYQYMESLDIANYFKVQNHTGTNATLLGYCPFTTTGLKVIELNFSSNATDTTLEYNSFYFDRPDDTHLYIYRNTNGGSYQKVCDLSEGATVSGSAIYYPNTDDIIHYPGGIVPKVMFIVIQAAGGYGANAPGGSSQDANGGGGSGAYWAGTISTSNGSGLKIYAYNSTRTNAAPHACYIQVNNLIRIWIQGGGNATSNTGGEPGEVEFSELSSWEKRNHAPYYWTADWGIGSSGGARNEDGVQSGKTSFAFNDYGYDTATSNSPYYKNTKIEFPGQSGGAAGDATISSRRGGGGGASIFAPGGEGGGGTNASHRAGGTAAYGAGGGGGSGYYTDSSGTHIPYAGGAGGGYKIILIY